MDFESFGKPKQITVEAVVTRADGTIEKLGVISYWHVNPFMRVWFYIKKFFRR